mmetsp:Transcript_4894/g.12484  ORF Transcript_4894/g.12484 Transcript_4894/m.12484 type:complete len:115 (-) Transcript_4894:1510-1854(-)
MGEWKPCKVFTFVNDDFCVLIPTLQSDVKEVIVDMCSRFDASESFRRATGDEVLALAAGNGCEEGVSAASVASVFDSEGWIAFNPTNIPTEREVHAQADGESVYRALFRKTNKQ